MAIGKTATFWKGGAMITEVEDYFAQGCGRCPRFGTDDCSTHLWQPGLAELRRICLEAGLAEEAKWGHPCYMHAGRNIVLFGAFRGDFRLTFFNAGLMKDPDGVLEKAGPNTQTAGVIRFRSNDAVQEMRPVLVAYLSEARDYAERGITAPKVERELDLPEELVEALDADPELAEAFAALTPGRQKSYVINLNGAKKAETRVARIEKFRDKIIAGKGATDR
ncbi:MAG: YdeI/OmpD-associated family protein [Pseudooceanicola sp.]